MDTFYEVLDIESGMILKEFDTLPEALSDLRRQLFYSDPAGILELALLRVEGERSTLVAMQEGLLDLVRRGPSVLNQAVTMSQTISRNLKYEPAVIRNCTSTAEWGAYRAA